jgi:hypothetical protein
MKRGCCCCNPATLTVILADLREKEREREGARAQDVNGMSKYL